MNILSTISDTQLTKVKVTYPLTLNIIKRHLRLDNDFVDDDDYIVELIKSATQLAENYIGKDIAYTKNVLRLDDFSDSSIQIMEGNFVSVDSVVNYASAPVGTIHSTSKHYDFFTIEWEGTITSDPLTITYYTGFANGDTPELIKQAILIKIADLYDNSRTSLIYSGLTDSKVFENILNGYQAIRF